MRIARKYESLAAAMLMVLAACSDPTENSSTDISSHRARWLSRGLTKYTYHYKITGFLISYAGHDIHIVVINGAVQAATDLTTGQAAPGSPSSWPTIDKLFDEAAQAAANGSLRGVRFDPTLDYPTELDLGGPPDASGSIFASQLILPP